MRVSRVVGFAVTAGLVPAAIWVAYRGAQAELYPSSAIPVVFGLLLAAAYPVLFLSMPKIRRRFDR